MAGADADILLIKDVTKTDDAWSYADDAACPIDSTAVQEFVDEIEEITADRKLDNPDAGKAVSEVLGEELTLYYDRNLEELKKVIACAEKSAKIRKAEERARTNLISKSKFSIDTNGKLANCESRVPEECEGFYCRGRFCRRFC